MDRPDPPHNLDIPKEFLDWMRGLSDFDLLMLLSEISEKSLPEALPVVAALRRNQQAYLELQRKLNPGPDEDLVKLFLRRMF